jgi:dihydroorotate dehydrogenase (NAD+) catalytic subunit
MPADLGVTVAGLSLKNPVIAGSGEATMDLKGLRAAVDTGVAAVVAKSTNESTAAKGQLAAAEYVLLDERWRAVPMGPDAPTPQGATLLNRSGLVEPPFDQWLETLAEADAYARARDAFLIGSLIVADPSEAARMAKEMQATGLRWLEVNVGAPHAAEAAPGAIRAAAGATAARDLIAPIRAAVSMPMTVKVAGEGDPLEAAAGAFDAGADAVCLAGRHLGFVPDVETRRPFLGTFGGVGGGWALPLSLRWVAKARARFGPEASLVGTNGARDGLDVARFLLSGASAVEMTTAALTDGPNALAATITQLTDYLERQGRSASAIVGEAADHVMTYSEAARTRTEGRGDTE